MISVSGYQTATAQQVAAKAELPPAELPVRRVGDKSVYLNKKGKVETYEVTGVDSESTSGQSIDDGCSWTSVNGFGPVIEWSECSGGSGTRTIKKRKGGLFPLEVGNKASWKFRGKNNKGDSWSDTRKCNVKGTANVTVPAGSFDTFHIVCSENWARWELHYAPELGVDVTYRRKPRGTSPSKSRYLELVSLTPMISVSGYQTATAQQVAAKAELPPAELPVRRVGDKSVYLNKKGKEETYEVTGVDSESTSGQSIDDGCSWTSVNGFGPVIEWSECPGGSGTRTIKKRKGGLFPLEVGNKASWKFRGKNNKGDSWSDTRKCHVKGTANVTVPAGSFDTFHIVCSENWARWELHYAPELGVDVTYRRKPRGNSQSKSRYLELVSFTPGS